MSYGNRKGGGNHGNKNSSHHYEFTHIKGLAEINKTLQAILASNTMGKDFETSIVKDSTGELFLEIRFYDNDLGDFGATNYYRPGETTIAAPPPVAPVVYIEGDGAATESTLLDVLELIERGVFEAVPGNSIEYAYYVDNGGGANPSGNKNVQTATYKTDAGATTVVIQTFVWDADDDVISITATI